MESEGDIVKQVMKNDFGTENDHVVEVLRQLVACDTQNPPRSITETHPIFECVRDHLPPGFSVEQIDHGNGCVSLLAKRGDPPVLFNCHLDTVPCGKGWTTPPLWLTIRNGRAIGRGACDIKGAAAALLAATHETTADFAILFTTDEEGTGSCCVANFCRSAARHAYSMVVVAEPTEGQAVIEHRGYLSVTGQFSGTAGHSSRVELLAGSANHRAAQWVTETLGSVSAYEAGKLAGKPSCFNVGRIDGGTKNNVISDGCSVSWSMRLPPMSSAEEAMAFMTQPARERVDWRVTFQGPSLPCSAQHRDAAEAFCQSIPLPMGPPVPFWTEAAIFSQAGLPAMVLGPGCIAQAHTADEWVCVDQLQNAVKQYQQVAEQVTALR